MPTVIVTGANRGIGLGIAKYYKDNGYDVIATSRKPSQELIDLGVQNLLLDVAKDDSITDFVSKVTVKIDLLINNAGILNGEKIETVTRQSLQEHFDVNTAGPLLLTKALLPLFNKGAKVASISSSMGCITNTAHPGCYGYRTTKSALNMLTKTMAIELKDREIYVVSIEPGGVKSDMNPNGDIEPYELAVRMDKVIAKLNAENSGEFRHREGHIVPY